MDARQARDFYLDYINTIYNERRVDLLERFYAPDVVPHPPIPGEQPGLAGLRKGVQGWLDSFSDIRLMLESLVYADNILAPRITITGVHTNTFLGIPATGRRIEIIDHPHYRLRNGKIVEYWDSPDMLTMMIQLGVVPAPGQAA